MKNLFSDTIEGYVPHNVIGIQFLESGEKIGYLNKLIVNKNLVQKSNVLMIYRYYDAEHEIDRVCAYCFTPTGLEEVRTAIFKTDESGYWYMCFDEEYPPFQTEKSATTQIPIV